MAKVKKYAKGGSYWVTVPDPQKPAAPKEKPAGLTGWNIDHSQVPTPKK